MLTEFISKQNLASSIWEFKFSKPKEFTFTAGDYCRLFLPSGEDHQLSLASAPDEPFILFTLKFGETPSKYKLDLLALKKDTICQLSEAIGTFHLPDNASKLLFFAGGIGITPYRSMILANTKHNISVRYVAKSNEFVYEDILKSTDYQPFAGRVSIDYLLETVPNYEDHVIYLAGPKDFCFAIKTELEQRHSLHHKIELCFFPGY